MPAKIRRKQINPDKYAGLIAAALPIPPQTEADNERLISLLDSLDQRNTLTPEEEMFAELLAVVIEDFENRHYKLPPVAPYEALQALMEDRGLRHKDIWPIIGNKGLTTEVLAGRRKISTGLAKRLAVQLNVPIELFI